MRTFGFLVAFAAFSTTFAAPLPGPGAKVVAVRDLPATPPTPAAPATPAVPSPSTPATPATPGVAAPGDAGVQDGTIHVGVGISGICVNLQVNVHTIVSQIHAILGGVEDKLEDTVEGAVTTVKGVTADVSKKVNAILPLLNKLHSEIQTALGKLVASAVPAVVGVVNGTEELTVKELGYLLREVEEEVSEVLCLVVTLIGNLFPAVAIIIRLIIVDLSLVLKTVVALVGGVSTFLCSLTTLVGPILTTFNWVIPELF